MSILKLLKQNQQYHSQEAIQEMINAAKDGHLQSILFLIKKGHHPTYQVFNEAIHYKQYELVKWLISYYPPFRDVAILHAHFDLKLLEVIN